MNYVDELPNKRFVPNAVIRIRGEYFSIREPDSGLSVPIDQRSSLSSLSLNPTTIDPFRATTSINTNSFKIVDVNNCVTSLFGNNKNLFMGDLAEIWLGRSGVDMDFSEYLKITDTYVTKVSKTDNGYTISTKEAKDRLATGAFDDQVKLAADILAATTEITVQDSTGLPTAGLLKIDDEFFSYNGIIDNNLQDCVRGELGSVPADHKLGADLFLSTVVQQNPVTMILQVLISSGGGGVYDVLSDGAGIDQNLIDIEEFETVRDELFLGDVVKMVFYNIESIKSTLEDELLYPFGLRLKSNNNGKIGLAVLNRAILNVDAPTLTHDEITKYPQLNIDDTKVYNSLQIEWNYFEPTEKFLNLSKFVDQESIDQFGERPAFKMQLMAVKESLNGQEMVNDIASLFFSRFAFPKGLIDVSAQMSSSIWNLGDKPILETNLLPNEIGELNFAESLEIIKKSLNFATGDVTFQLAFTAFTGLRLCYIAPSDTIQYVFDQKWVEVGAGRGVMWRAGWAVMLYDNDSRDDASAQVNYIESISGDEIKFLDEWDIDLTEGNYRIRFADYDDVVDQQKKFCFTSNLNNNFPDGTPPYQITFG